MSIELDDKVGTNATINGTARNAKMGAVLLTDDRTPIYIDGLESWSGTGLDGKSIEVTGKLCLRSLAPDPVVDDDGAVSHGLQGDSYVFENANWKAS